MRALYYIIVDIDLHPDLESAYDGVEKIGITADKSWRDKPIIYMQGKGKASDGCSLSLKLIYEIPFLKDFERLNITWVLDFLQNNSDFSEKELQQEILSHGLKLVTEEY